MSEEDVAFDEEGVPLSGHAPIPKWLRVTYVLLIIWGMWSLFIFWNGTVPFLDRGAWGALQQAAQTTQYTPTF